MMDTKALQAAASTAIEASADDLYKLGQTIWKNPELNFQEHKAHAVLTLFLEKQGFNVQRQYVVDTAFRASYGKEGLGPHVVVFCEYDALPGIGHACGHNLIAEIGVATGIGIKAAMEAVGKPFGQITVLGSPAEEGGGGKLNLIDGGALVGVDVALMSHPCGYNTPRFKSLAVAHTQVQFNGKASHASCSPWNGINALDAAVLCYQNLSCHRQQFKPGWQVHGIITKGGERPNIIPEVANMQYYLRASTASDLKILKQKATECFEAAAKATGCTVDIEYTSEYSEVIINDTLINMYMKHGEQMGFSFETRPEIVDTVGGSTDMGNVSYVVPSIHPLYCLSPGAMPHTKEFTVYAGDRNGQDRTLKEAKLLAFTALDIYTRPDLLAQAQADFQSDLTQRQVKSYKN